MTNVISNILGVIHPKDFLKKYWQKKPCVIRQALPAYQCPISPEELASLACEDGVEARLVIKKSGKHDWQVQYGPLAETDFRSLPETHWTLLVQGVEQYHKEISALFRHFNFVPNWRIDDVMISYATKHGGVGPHLDSYDVFLLQGMGRRRWQINHSAYTEKDFIPGLELRIIDNFCAEQEWVLEPGDMLYLPPGVAHNGIAPEPCMTLSIGFLSPSRSELVSNFIDEVVSGAALDTRFADADRHVPKHAGEISKTDLNRITAMMRSSLADKTLLQEWFGKYITRGKGAHPAAGKTLAGKKKFADQFLKKKIIYRRDGVRTAFLRHRDRLTLCIEGESMALAPDYLPLVLLITEQPAIRDQDLERQPRRAAFIRLLAELYRRDIYHF